MNAYPTYKPSGIEWLGDIPEHWDVWKLSSKFKDISSGTTPLAGNDRFYNNGTIPWVNTGDLNDSFLESCKKKVTATAIDECSALKIHPSGVLIIAMYGATIGKLGIVNFEACCNQACCVIGQSKSVSTEYLFYWLMGNRKEIVNRAYGGGQPNISQEVIKRLKITCPLMSEQTAITNYLDDKTSKLDRLIKNKKEQIAQLKEIRQIEINTAVTKGLNPTAKLKPSGIEWLGDVPEHWEVKRLKQIVSTKITDGPHTTPDFVDEGVPFISASAINHNRINFERFRGYITEELDAEYSEKVKPQRNDIFIVKSGATTGRIACVETDMNFNIWSPLALVRSNPNRTYYKYIFFQLQSQVFKTQIELGWSFGTQENIGMGILECLFLAVPQQKEQTAIANYLDEKTSKLDQLVNNLENQIAQLQELRKIEIFNAVTGKIKVA